MAGIDDFLGGAATKRNSNPAAEKGPWDDFKPQGNSAQSDGPWNDFQPGSIGSFLDEPKKRPGLVGTVLEGAKSTARSIGTAANTYLNDSQSVVDAAKAQSEAPKNESLERFYSDIEARKQGMGEDPGVWDAVKAVGGAVAENPKGAGLALAEQLPNSAAALGGGYAGMKVGGIGGAKIGGLVAGPAGAAVGGTLGVIGGGLVGMFGANTALETGGKAMQAAQDGEFTQDERSQVMREGAVKGGVITAVDAATLGATKWITGATNRAMSAAAEVATRKALTDSGVDVASKAAIDAAAKNPAIRNSVISAQEAAIESARAASDTLGKNLARYGAAGALETIGEGLGEYLGELAATGKADMVDAVLESVLSLGQSGAEITWSAVKNRAERIAADKRVPEEAPPAAPQAPGNGIDFEAGLVPGVDVGAPRQEGIPAGDMQGIDFSPVKLPEAGPLSAAVNAGIDSGATTLTSPANPRFDIPAQPRGSFAEQAELARLIEQERADVEGRRELAQLVGQERNDQASRMEAIKRRQQELSGGLADTDQRVAGSMAQESEAARIQLLDSVLSGLDETSSPARQFGNALRRAGYQNTEFTERERQIIQRFADARSALTAPEATTIPAAPNELDPAAMGIRERSNQAQTESAPRDKVAEVVDLVSQGWRIAIGRRLMSPKGKVRNLNTAEYSAAKEAAARIRNGMEAGNATTQVDAVGDQGRGDVGAGSGGNARPVRSIVRGRGSDAGASVPGMRAPGAVGNAVGAGSALNAAQPSQMAAQAAQANDAQAAAEQGAAPAVTPTAEQSSPVAGNQNPIKKPVSQWTAEELRARLSRDASGESPLAPENRAKLEQALTAAESAKAEAEAKKAEAADRIKKMQAAKKANEGTFLVGRDRDSAERISVRGGVVYMGEYPAENMDGEDITVPEGATKQQIFDALIDGEAITPSVKMFGRNGPEMSAADRIAQLKAERANMSPVERNAADAVTEAVDAVSAASVKHGIEQTEESVLSRIGASNEEIQQSESAATEGAGPSGEADQGAAGAAGGAERQARGSDQKRDGDAPGDEVAGRGRQVAQRKKLKASGNIINDLRVLGVDPQMMSRITTNGVSATESVNDLGEIADRLRSSEFGYMFDDVNNDSAQGLVEYLRRVASGDASPLNAARMEADIAAREEHLHKQGVNQRAAELGLKKIGGKRTLQVVEADIARVEAEIEAKERELSEMEARKERAAIQAESVYDEILGADMSESDWMTWLSSSIAGTYTQEEIDNAKRIQADREDARAAANADDAAGIGAQEGAGGRQGTGANEAQPGRTEGGARSAAARGEVGAALSSAERKAVLKTLVDVYKQNRAPKEFKGLDSNGNERYGYAHSPEYFVRSDITGAMVRYYVTLPDGRIAHPTELFADYTQSDIEAEIQKQDSKEKANEEGKAWRNRQIDSIANQSLQKVRAFRGEQFRKIGKAAPDRLVEFYSEDEGKWFAVEDQEVAKSYSNELAERGYREVETYRNDAAPNQPPVWMPKSYVGFDLTRQTNAEAAAEFKRQQEEAAKKDETPASPAVFADQGDLLNTQGALFNSNRDVAPKNDIEAYAKLAAGEQETKLTETQAKAQLEWRNLGQRDGTKTQALFFYETAEDMAAKRGSMQYGEVTSYDGGKWQIDGTSYDSLAAAKKAAEQSAIVRLIKDGYVAPADVSKNPQKTNTSSEPVQKTAESEQVEAAETTGKITDFGEKLGGARKDRVPSLEKELSDDDISTLPLSKIWPAAEIDAIDDKFVAAVAYAARAEVPAKPRVSYKVASWVAKVKIVRGIAQKVVSGDVTKERLSELLKGMRSLDSFSAKVAVLEAIDRNQWGRIGVVGEHPNAYRYGEDGQKIPMPSVSVEIDGKSQRFEGAKSVSEITGRINAALEGDVEAKKMQFEVRGRGGSFSINKKGDKEYRKLKSFGTDKEAFGFIKNNYADLVAAWESVKESDNVRKVDVRNAENRPRTGNDWRNGKDVTSKQFEDAFGLRGVEFGIWVLQGADAKERQGMLNQAFDAMHDLAAILGIPPKAISLNGTLGLGFGSRGHGAASAHFEPGTLVINLTKTRGAGTLAHEWFHALDNYFARMRNAGNEKTMADVGNDPDEYRRQNFVTYKPEPLYVHKTQRSTPITRAELDRYHAGSKSPYWNPENWHKDPKHPEGVRAEVEVAFADLVNALNESPMAKRARLIDKTATGYWSRIIERGARSFENYIISKMMEGGYNNDYLANVREVQDFPRSKERYPYLLPEEVAPIAAAFDNLFATIEAKETDRGIALESRADRSAIDTAMRRMDRFVSEFERGTMKDSDTQSLGDTPTVLQFLGAENLQMQIDGATVRKVLAGKHRYDVSPQALRNVAQALYDPLAVFRSATGTGLVVLSEVQSNNGNPVVAAIHLAKRKGGVIINDIASIHEKTDAERSVGAWLRDDLLRYVRNENDLSGAATRHLLPASVATSMKGHMNNVATEADVVKSYGPRYSLSSGVSATNKPLNSRQKFALGVVQNTADKFSAEYAGAAALDIRVVYSRDDIPARYRPSPYAEGVYHDSEGIIYLVASNLPNSKRAWQVLMHETVGHYGLANMMGDQFSSLWETVLKRATSGQPLNYDPLPGDANYETVEAVRRLYPEANDSEVAQEVMARMAETMPNVGWFRMAMARISIWMKNAARAFGFAPEATMADVRRLVEMAGYHVRTGANLERAPAGRDAAFASRGAAVESKADTIEVDGVNRPTKNSNGRPIAQTEEGLRNFWRWFGSSRVVDDQGRPLVVYHGTASDITEFDIGRSGESTGNTGFYGAGAYFSEDADYASGFSFWARRSEDQAPNVVPVYLSLKNPAYINITPRLQATIDKSRATAEKIIGTLTTRGADQAVIDKLRNFVSENKFEPFMGTLYNALGGGSGTTALLKDAGFDGVTIYGGISGKEKLAEAVAFSSTQIKSATGNRGTFDPANPDIRESRAPFDVDRTWRELVSRLKFSDFDATPDFSAIRDDDAQISSGAIAKPRSFSLSDTQGNQWVSLRVEETTLDDGSKAFSSSLEASADYPKGTGIATKMYLAALNVAKKNGYGWISEGVRSDESLAIYRRLKNAGVPFKEIGGASYVDARTLSGVDIQAVADGISEASARPAMESRAAAISMAGAWSVAEPSRMDDLIYSLQDKQIDLRRVIQSITATGKKIADDFNAYLQEELFHGRAAKGVKDFLDFELRPLLREMQMRGIDMGDFEEYLWNRHAEERNNQIAKINPDMPDGGSGINTADARAYLAGLSADQKRKMEALAARIDQMNRNSQRVLVESGLEKQETIDAWNGAYQHYVPLQREDVDTGHTGTGKGFSIRGSSSKRAMGSGKKVVDIIANLTQQRERNIVRAEKNRVSNALFGLAAQNPNPDFWKVDEAPKERVVQETAIYTVLDADGNKIDEFTRMAEAERLANKTPGATIDQSWADRVTERIVPGFKNRDNVILTRIDGEDHYVILNERDDRAMRLSAAMKNLDMDNMGRALSIVGKATRYLASVNTQYNPVFGVINLVRDVQGALLNLQSTQLAGEQKRVAGYTVDALRGIYADIRAHRRGEKPSSKWAELFEEFQKEGGQTGYRDQYANAEARAEAIVSELSQFKEGKFKMAARAVFGWLSDYNETMENAVRLAAYKTAKEKGLSNQQAASIAKNLTVNFNRKGQMTTQIGALYAFFNASVQGTARMAETLFEKNDGDAKKIRLSKLGKRIITGGIMLGSMQAMLLAAAGFDDDEPPEFIRERNLILPIGDGKYLTLAMPLGFHVIPGIGRIATEFALSGFKDPAKRAISMLGMFAETFNPVGSSGFSIQTLTPSVVDPFAALAENRDFTGREIYRENFNANDPSPGHARAKDVATFWSRYISESINFITGGTEFKPGAFSPSPDAIDYLIAQATGGVGREINKVAQTAGATYTGDDLPLYKIPLVGRFVGDTEGQSGNSQKFYNAIREINLHEREVKGLRESGRMIEAQEYIAENPVYRMRLMANRVESQVRKLRDARRKASEDGDSDKVRAINEQITGLMTRFNERASPLLEQ